MLFIFLKYSWGEVFVLLLKNVSSFFFFCPCNSVISYDDILLTLCLLSFIIISGYGNAMRKWTSVSGFLCIMWFDPNLSNLEEVWVRITLGSQLFFGVSCNGWYPFNTRYTPFHQHHHRWIVLGFPLKLIWSRYSMEVILEIKSYFFYEQMRFRQVVDGAPHS